LRTVLLKILPGTGGIVDSHHFPASRFQGEADELDDGPFIFDNEDSRLLTRHCAVQAL
jgi:hypothetical protein